MLPLDTQLSFILSPTVHHHPRAQLLIPSLSLRACARVRPVAVSTPSTTTSATDHTVNTAMSCGDFAHIIRQPRQSDEHYRKQLTPQQFLCSRQAGTERPGTGEFLHNKRKGTYTCVSCSAPLFESSTKFESGTGWPSFYDKIDNNVKDKVDTSHGMRRVEVVCAACDGHLGHVFEDGPRDKTGLRYCINSASLGFVPDGASSGEETEIVDHDNVCAVPPKKK